MVISEINPFIRYANRIMLLPQKIYRSTEDCRIFYIVDASDSNLLQIDSRTYKLKRDAMIFIASHTPYKFVINKPTEIISINFDFTQYRKDFTFPFEIKSINPLSEYNPTQPFELFDDYLPLNRHIYLEDADFLFDSLNKILEEYGLSNPYSQEASSAMLKLLLINIISANEKATLYANPYYAKSLLPIDKTKKFIQEHYNENLTNDIIARQVDYHSYHLNRIFKKIEGISIHKYLINYRIIMAEKLLLETDLPITFIATQVGFENTTSFTQNFKAKNNLPPLKYRGFHRKIF